MRTRSPPPPPSSSQKHNDNTKKKTKKRKQYIPLSFLKCQSLTHVVGFPPQSELVTTPVASDFVKELFLDRFVKEIVKPFQPDKTKNCNNDGSNATTTAPTTIDSNAGYYHVMVSGKLVKKRRISKDNNQPNRTTTAPSEQRQPTDDIDDGLTRKKIIWKENIVIGTNQCLRLLENLNANYCDDTTTAKAAPTTTSTKDAARTSSLIVVAKDIYPPTMCCAVPVLAKRLGIPLLLLPGKASLELGRALNNKRTSILIFSCDGSASALTRSSSSNNSNINNNSDSNSNSEASSDGGCHEKEISDARTAMASFVSFIRDQIP
jgi:ribosomal protein L7Ae-like RNA K-turn-binding protein